MTSIANLLTAAILRRLADADNLRSGAFAGSKGLIAAA